ncbi:hypothetical protein [Allorhodopirellula heiligendammensis]|uniref:Selenocysteine synthase n=1 Tax=Allorhodopirellula heiligendammensis TaxID=2714739 RepID=A0A5C6C3E2_9BACT|nr:hypothetical protein [Allorhodopirellula heiligendammensis]TWU18537.1 selenocysteine synthase [Allorhodopirellula heiligendammensis]
MALPPWTVDLLRRGVADLARQVTDHEAATSLKEHASKMVDELPKAAREKVGSILRQAEARAQPLKDAWQSGDWWSDNSVSLSPSRIINGTGWLLDERGSGVGLPSDALAAAIPHLSGDAARDPDLPARLSDEIAAAIANRRSHSPASACPLGAIVTNSLDASLALVATLGGRGGCIWVPRSAAYPMYRPAPGGARPARLLVDRLRGFARGAVREFGYVNGGEDWPSDEVLHRHADHPGRPPKPSAATDSSQLSRTSQNVVVRMSSSKSHPPAGADPGDDWIEVAVLPIASVFPLDASTPVSSVIDELDRGADVVVLAGSVLAGMPDLSLVVGNDEIIKRMRQCSTFQLVDAPTAMIATVAASVAAQAKGQSPVGQLIGVSEDNLTDRAQRLATQLSGCDWVTGTRITEYPARIGVAETGCGESHPAEPNGDPAATESIASRQVVLTLDPARDANAVAQRLANGATGLLCRVDNNELIIDLRWITPEQQAQISDIACKLQ